MKITDAEHVQGAPTLPSSNGARVVDESGKRVLAALSSEARALIERLRMLVPGEIVTYVELNEIVGYNLQKKRGALDTAVRRVLVDHQIHIGTVRSEGVRRLNETEAAQSLEARVRRTRSAARKGLRTARELDLLAVDECERAPAIMRASLLSLIDRAGSARGQTRVLAVVKQVGDMATLPYQKTVAALKE